VLTTRLEKVLAQARLSPFYRHVGRKMNWRDVPLTTKEDLRHGYPFGFLAGPRSLIQSYHESSGTEGKPIASYFSEADWRDVASRFLRNAIGLSSKDTFFIKTPYSMVTTAHQAQHAGEMAGALIVPGDNRTSNMPYSRTVQLLRDLEITVTWSLPTEVLLWGLAAEANGMSLERDFPQLRAFWVAGEQLSAARKRALSSLWKGKKVFEDYGSTETGSLGGELACGQLHLWSDRILFELLQPNGDFLSKGQGRLVVTPLEREAMPLLRYLLDDEVEIFDCDCGSKLPAAKILGRSGSAITLAGHKVFPLEIEQAVYSAGESLGLTFWRGRHDAGSLEIEFCSREPGELKLDIDAYVKCRRLPLDRFVDLTRLKETLTFSKPKYLYRRDETPPRFIHYA